MKIHINRNIAWLLVRVSGVSMSLSRWIHRRLSEPLLRLAERSNDLAREFVKRNEQAQGCLEGILNAWGQHAETYGQDARGVIFVRKYDHMPLIRDAIVERSLGVFSINSLRWIQPNGSTLVIRKLKSLSDSHHLQGMEFTFCGFYGDHWPKDLIEVAVRHFRSHRGIRVESYPAKFIAQVEAE